MWTAFVSVNQSYAPGDSLDSLTEAAQSAWPLTLELARKAEFLVAVYEGRPIMAWSVFDAYATEHTYETTGGTRPRKGFRTGSPVPVRPEWHDVPALRRGVAVKDS